MMQSTQSSTAPREERTSIRVRPSTPKLNLLKNKPKEQPKPRAIGLLPSLNPSQGAQ